MLLVGVFKQETLRGDTGQEEGEADMLLPVLSVSFWSPQQHLFTLAEALSSCSSCWSQFAITPALAEPTFWHLSPRCQHLLKRLGPSSWILSLKLRHQLWGTEFQFSGPFLWSISFLINSASSLCSPALGRGRGWRDGGSFLHLLPPWHLGNNFILCLQFHISSTFC